MSTKITTEQIKELRDSTGISVMQCKRALEEAEGDMNKALAILKKASSDIALKKLDRELKDGRSNCRNQTRIKPYLYPYFVRQISYPRMKTS